MNADWRKTKKHLVAELEELRAELAAYKQGRAADEADRETDFENNHKLQSAYNHLNTQRAFTNAIVDSLNQGICAVDHLGNVTFMNRAACQMLGWESAELFGKSIHEFIHRDCAHKQTQEQGCPIARLLLHRQTDEEPSRLSGGSQGFPQSLHSEQDLFTRKDGSTFPVSYTISPIVLYKEITGLVLAFEDMTRQHCLAEYLRDSDSRFQAIFEATTTGIALINLTGHYLQANQRFLAMTGYTEAELTQMHWRDLIFIEDYPITCDVSLQLRTSEQLPVSAQRRYVHKDGSLLWMASCASLIRSATGVPEYYVTVVEDITARKQLEDQVHNAQAVPWVIHTSFDERRLG